MRMQGGDTGKITQYLACSIHSINVKYYYYYLAQYLHIGSH